MKLVFLAQLDVFDPASGVVEYGGEIGLCAISAADALGALQAILDLFKSEDIQLKKIDYFGTIEEYEGDWEFFSLTLPEFRSAALEHDGLIFSNIRTYRP